MSLLNSIRPGSRHHNLYDIVFLKHIPSTRFFTDLISNYDIFLCSIASLLLHRVDIPKDPIVFVLSTLQDMVHLVITEFGFSASNCRGELWSVSSNPPPQFQGQVNGDSMAIWAIVSTPLINFRIVTGYRAYFKFCIFRDGLILVKYGFLENSTLIQVSPSTLTPTNNTIKLPRKYLTYYQ